MQNHSDSFYNQIVSILPYDNILSENWRLSGDFFQAQWLRILNIIGDDPVMLWVFGGTIVSMAVYWTLGIIYTIMDITNKPAALRRYKIQPGTNEPVDTQRLIKVIIQVLINQTVVAIPISFIFFKIMSYQGIPDVYELPTFHRLVFDIVICTIVEEIGFYYGHRLLHNRYLYKHIHKIHHEWTAPISVTAVYCHPLEHIVSNLFPALLGIGLLKSHVTTAWLWLTFAMISTVNTHSGYSLSFFPSPEAHDFHHMKFNQCYGVLGILDRLHGTDTLYRASRAAATKSAVCHKNERKKKH